MKIINIKNITRDSIDIWKQVTKEEIYKVEDYLLQPLESNVTDFIWDYLWNKTNNRV